MAQWWRSRPWLPTRFDQGEREVLCELLLLGTLVHTNIVRLFGVSLTPGRSSLVYGLAELGSLEDAYGRLPPPARVRAVTDACLGLAFLHERRYLHRDIKPDNIFVRDLEGSAMIGDVGLAKVVADAERSRPGYRFSSFELRGAVGTAGYIDPEALQLGAYSTATDMYSIGVTLLRVLTERAIVSEGRLLVSLLLATDSHTSAADLAAQASPAWSTQGPLALRVAALIKDLLGEPRGRPSAAATAARLSAQ